MKPGVVMAVDNRVMFAGDDGNWTFSANLPNVYKIDQVQWIYGDIILAIVEKSNGDHAIQVCNDYGKGTWTETFTTSKQIFSFDLVAPGWALISTETGYYQTVDAGRTISLLNATYKDHQAICVMGQVVLAHDGKSKILRSLNGAATFSQVFALSTTPTRSITATIAGTPYRMLAAFGELVYESINNGASWSLAFTRIAEDVIQIINIDDSATPDFIIKTRLDADQFGDPCWMTYRIDHELPTYWKPVYSQPIIESQPIPKMAASCVLGGGTSEFVSNVADVQPEVPTSGGLAMRMMQSPDAVAWSVRRGANHALY